MSAAIYPDDARDIARDAVLLDLQECKIQLFFFSFKARSLARSPVRRKGNSAALSGNNGSLLLYVIKVTHK